MANLVEFEQAAVMLGLSHDELAQLRSQNKIFGYRDGASWKFKESELAGHITFRKGERSKLATAAAKLL